LTKEALHGRLMRRDAGGEAERSKDGGRLSPPPLGDGEHGEMMGQDGNDREGEHGSEGKASAAGAAGIGNTRKGGDKVNGRGDDCLRDCGGRRLHQTLLCG
jgi:hypothetical protein